MTTQFLQERISGTVFHRGDSDYEQARRVPGWNEIKPERYPDLIVQVASEDDVIETVNFAREQHMKIVSGGWTQLVRRCTERGQYLAGPVPS